MLILSRKKNEAITIGDQIEVCVLAIQGDTVKLGIAAPQHVKIYRKELYEAIQLENRNAVVAVDDVLSLLQKNFKKNN